MSQQTPKRRRGVVLTPIGLARLRTRIRETEILHNDGVRYTLEDLSYRTCLDPKTISKLLEGNIGLDKRTLEHCFSAFDLELNVSDFALHSPLPTPCQDWAEAIDVSVFYGRTEELAKLKHWITQRCRLIAILGMGGIGKTSLAVKLAEQIQDQFEFVVWRSLRNSPPLKELLANLIQFFSRGQPISLPETVSDRISHLMAYLRSHHCLLILDNAESILCSGDRAGHYLPGYEAYGQLLKQVGETAHQSTLVLTSREKPQEIASLEGGALPVQSLHLKGLKVVDGLELFRTKSYFRGTKADWEVLSQRYGGNPLALKIVSTTIQELFNCDIAEFIAQGATVFGDIRDLLDQQFDRLSALEKELMYWLAINREPVSLADLRSDLVSPVSPTKLLEALESLGRRCLIETSSGEAPTRFTLQPVVMEYVTDCLIQQVCAEIVGDISLFNSHALIKAQAKDYVRATQTQLILQPVIDELLTTLRTKKGIEDRLRRILSTLQAQFPHEPGYTAGNILNLLCHLQTDLTGYDFSNLTVWQAYLQDTPLPQVNFAGADLSKSVFAKIFTPTMVVAFSPDGKLLATGHSNYQIHLWEINSGQQLLTCQGPKRFLWSVVFNPTGDILASGGEDQMIKLWSVATGQCLKTLFGHTGGVRSVCFANNDLLLSGSADQTIRLWDLRTGQCCQVLQGHTDTIWAIALSPDGKTLASGADDRTVKLWDMATGRCTTTLLGHTDWVRSVAFSPDGTRLASCGLDQTVRLWDVAMGQCIGVLTGHTNAVFSVVFVGDGQTLASSSLDRTIRLWDLGFGHCVRTLQGHSNSVYAIATNPAGMLASGSDDQTVRLWDIASGACIRTLRGQMSWFSSVAFSSDGQILASGSEDRMVRLWDLNQGSCCTFRGHTDLVTSVAFSPNGRTLASSSADKNIRLWDILQGHCYQVLRGHAATVSSLAFSPDGSTLASGSHDGTVRLWDLATGQTLKTLWAHIVQSIAFSPDGKTLAVGSFDETVKLWDITTGQCCRTLQGHSDWAWWVDFSPDGLSIATGSTDCTVRLWDFATGECLHILQGHRDWIWAIAFSPQGKTLASASSDSSVKLWDLATGQCLATLEAHDKWVMAIAFSPQGKTLVSAGALDEANELPHRMADGVSNFIRNCI